LIIVVYYILILKLKKLFKMLGLTSKKQEYN